MKKIVRKVFNFIERFFSRGDGDGFIQELWKVGNAYLDDVKP